MSKCPTIFLFLIFMWSFACINAQEVKQIDINAETIEFDSELGNNAKKLIGNVTFRHEDVFMTCDSAYYYSETNTVDAFSRVHLWQGDTLNLYGDFLKYSGNERMANVRNNVTLIDKENQLTTEYIDYDIRNNLAFYLNGGKILNGNNTLTSMRGYYYTKLKLAYFKDSVVVTNPDYTMYCDTLRYNTLTEISYFLGPTNIIAEENSIYCENGWYDTRNNISQFNRNAFIVSGEKTMKGDSIYYERETGLGKAFNNVELVDSSQNLVLMGNIAVYNEKTDYAMLTDRALMIQIDQDQDSLFVHADTLRAVPDTIPDKQVIQAYYKVKIFRADLQGKCDSLVYTENDSAFRFYGEPVLWSDENQLTAEKIEIYTRNQKLEKIELINSAFIVAQEDSIRFNQIKGRNMTGWFTGNELTLIEVDGNGQTLYFAKDREEITGLNKAISSSLKIYLKDKKINRLLFITTPDATYYPLEKIAGTETKLEGFRWFDQYRPVSKEDVFRWE